MTKSHKQKYYLLTSFMSGKLDLDTESVETTKPAHPGDLGDELSEVNLERKNQLDSDVFEEEDDDQHLVSLMTLKRSDSALLASYIDLSKLLLLSDFDFGLDLVSGPAKKRFSDMKHKTKQRLKKLKDDSMKFKPVDPVLRKSDVARLQERVNARLSRFDKRIHENLGSSNTEKAFYALAVFLIACSGFVIGKYPTYFHVLHTVMFCMLMPIRFYTYFKQLFQFYLADLCYYVNILLMMFIWWFPHSKSLFILVFSLAMGTLLFAVITWRNSLVLHSIEKTTSSFIHIMPPITMFVIVHELPYEYVATRFPAVASIDHWNFINGIIWTSIYYTIWQVCYHYFITIKRREQIAKGTVTSFTYLKHKNSKLFLGRLVNGLPYTWMQIAAFTLIQFGYQILTMVFCPIWFKYKHACGAFVTFIFVWASYNGATYYIDVFGKRLEKEVTRLKQEIDELKRDLFERSTDLFDTLPLQQPTEASLSVPPL